MSNSSGIVCAAGDSVGNFLAGIPPVLIDFSSGIAAGARIADLPLTQKSAIFSAP